MSDNVVTLPTELVRLHDEVDALTARNANLVEALRVLNARAEKAEFELAQFKHALELARIANSGQSEFQPFCDALQRQQQHVERQRLRDRY